MARNFDGTDDNLTAAANSVTGIDVTTRSFGGWILRAGDPSVAETVMLGASALSAGNLRFNLVCETPVTAGWRPRVSHTFSTTTGVFTVTNDITNTVHHIMVVYDNSLTTNVPTIYVDGTSVAVTTSTTPVGTASTGADNLRFGESVTGTTDLAATVSHMIIMPSLLDAAQVNRTKWWGRPGGGAAVNYPFLTSKLVDEGSSPDTLTATGTTVVSLPVPTVRPGSGMGW